MGVDGKVSVIIPTYNRILSLKRAMRSILAQMYTNIELIVVDDESSDGTREYLLSLKNPRIKPLLLDSHGRGNAARNVGIRRAEGEYLAFLDDDDEWLPDKLEKQVDVLNNNSNVGIVYSAATIVLGNENIKYNTIPKAKGRIYNELLMGNVIGTTSTVVLRRELLSQYGMFKEAMSPMEDYELWIRLSKHTEIDFVEKPLILYNCTTKGNSISKNVQSNIQAFNLISMLHKKEIDNLPWKLRRKRRGWFNATLGLKYLYNYRQVYAAKCFLTAFFQTFSFRYLISSLLSLVSPKLLFHIRSKIRTR